MCGIAGYFGKTAPEQLEAMLAAISHRGPDGSHIWQDPKEGIGLGHVRLAIIDPTAAADQPMESCGGRYITIFNGEIFNFRALNQDLIRRGYKINPNSDTACLAPLYDLHGVDMLKHLNGMFAFAIWDRQANALFLARDAVGIKPLYYSKNAKGIVFASELKGLLANSTVSREVDAAAVYDYALRLWSPGRRTLLSGVSKLLPGEYLLMHKDSVVQAQWSQPVLADESAYDLRPEPKDFGHLFDEVVADQCVSDVPIGAFLSGGVDSTAIVSAMARTGHRPKQTYCVGFNGPGMESEGFGNDLEYARLAAETIGVPLTPIMIDTPKPEDFENLPYMLDEPQADPAPIFVAAISRAAQQDGIKVLMSGAGGDDIFTGYRRHQAASLRDRMGPLTRLAGRAALRALGKGTSPLHRRAAKLATLLEGSDEEFLDRSFHFNDQTLVLGCLSGQVREAARTQQNDVWRDALARSSGAPLVERLLYLERFGFLPDHNLNYTDKAAMTHGVEVRVPFLDSRVISAAARIPWRLKIKGLREKWFLKQALADHVPASILTRRKTGFGGPVRHWVQGPLKAMIGDTIASRSFRERGIFDMNRVTRAFDDTLQNRTDAAYLVLELVMIEFWMRAFVDQSNPRQS